MQDLTSYIVFFMATVVGTAISKPLWSIPVHGDYLYPSAELNALPQYFAAYQGAHSPHYVQANADSIPDITILTSGKPQASEIFTYGLYYGTPIYDLRIPLNPVYPILTPGHPIFPPRPILPPTSVGQPADGDDIDDGIEKLDSKIDLNAGTKKPGSDGQDDDSITVEAI